MGTKRMVVQLQTTKQQPARQSTTNKLQARNLSEDKNRKENTFHRLAFSHCTKLKVRV